MMYVPDDRFENVKFPFESAVVVSVADPLSVIVLPLPEVVGETDPERLAPVLVDEGTKTTSRK